MINIQDIIPHLKPKYVAMDKDGTWVWFTHKPFLTQERNRWQVSDGTFSPLDMFDIAPADDWTKSLIKVGGK